MNLLAQTPFKAQPTPRLSKRTPQIHLTILQIKQTCTTHYFPRHCARFVQETVLRLQTFSSALSNPAERAFSGSLAYKPLTFIPVAQLIVCSVTLRRVCRAVVGIKARNGSTFEESNEEVVLTQNSSLTLFKVQPHNSCAGTTWSSSLALPHFSATSKA